MIYVARRIDLGPVRYIRLALPLGAVAEAVSWLRGAVWTATGVTLLLALLVSLVLARRVSAPLAALAEAARYQARVACCDGQRVPITSRDEVGTLAAAFNEMSQARATHIVQMEQDRQKLRAIFRSMVEGVLVLDATQRIQFLNEAAARLLGLPLEAAQGRKLWKVLRHHQLGEVVNQILTAEQPHHCELEWRAAKQKVLAVHGSPLPGTPLRGAVLVFHDITHLRQLERVRQDFVANASHELKTPLAAIQAIVETLLDSAMHDPDHSVRFLQRIQENTDRLQRLVHDLLTLGRIESGEEVLEQQPLPVQAAVAACLTRQEHRAAAKGLRLELVPAAEPVTALADEEALAVILDNLVDNAIKYTSPRGRVILCWFAEQREAVVQVEDTGVGIPEKDLPRIFERFYRVDKARSRELGGTGLGLSIVNHLVQALGGRISAASQLGAGSTFTLRLPLAESAKSAQGVQAC
jgi:two-component system phosphate regulon sensor histidine kinase PhoR